MSPIRRVWTCCNCGRRGIWREGYSWTVQRPIQSLDSFAVSCSQACASAVPQPEGVAQ